MHKASSSLSVILPTYNEAGNIVRLVQSLLEVAGDDVQVVVVDDSSPDGTADLVRDSFGADARVKLVVRTLDRGLARSVRCGIEQSSGENILVMDTDFNHEPAVVPLMRDLLRHVDLVVGSRFIVGGGMEDEWRYYGSYLYNIGIRTLLGTRIQDNLSGFFAVRREVLARLDFDKIFYGYVDYFFRLLHQATGAGAHVVEVPVFYRRRSAGQSKTSFTKVFAQYTLALGRFVAASGLRRRRPAPFSPGRP